MKKVIFILTCLLLAVPCSARVISVDDDGPADFNSIQEAIDSSWDGDVIEVRPGTYWERINFYGLDITVTSTNPNDVNSVYATVIDANGIGNVVTFDSLEDSSSVLRGFTIQNGQTGIYCFYSDPVIANCIVRDNTADGIRGYSASPRVTNCQIMANLGSGIYDCDGEISGCMISGNYYGLQGCDGRIVNSLIIGNWGIGAYMCNANISNSIISGNYDSGLAGCDGLISNCIICGNSQDGLYQCRGNIKNCTIGWNKRAGFYLDDSTASPSLSNNIIVKSGSYGIQEPNGHTSLRYNDIWGNFNGSYYEVPPGSTDIHRNPLFALDGYWDINDVWVEGDYHLKSEAGRWDPNDQKWVIDDVTSFCVDAGDPYEPTGNEPYPNGDVINQGAYGGTEQASKSPYQVIYCTADILADLDGNCKVDFNDFAIMASDWFKGEIQEVFHEDVNMLTYDERDFCGNFIVWTDKRQSGNYDIYAYNLSTDTELPICSNPGVQIYPAIAGNIVVWQDKRSGEYDIYGYDLSTGTEFPICTASGDQRYPAIDANIVVWYDCRGIDPSIEYGDTYGYNLSTGSEFRISDSWGRYYAVSGNIVVWEHYSRICGYDLSTDTEFPICPASTADQIDPDISGNIVVWQDNRTGEYDIYGYDLSTDTEFPICTASGVQYDPAIDGNIVVWGDSRSGQWDIYGYDVSAEIEFAICIGEGSPSRHFISGNTVAWQDAGSGDLYWRELCDVYFAGDINVDCKVDFSDFANIATNWLECNLHPQEACWE